ncbi:MAG: shufflon system plasmid conjugative transfer pilus tip adhesin PilV [Arsenophonus sp. NEOnobi-MAG3]
MVLTLHREARQKDFYLNCCHWNIGIALLSKILRRMFHESDNLYHFQIKDKAELNWMHSAINSIGNNLNIANTVNAKKSIIRKKLMQVTISKLR